MVNVEMFRKVADRIDPETRPDDIAGYFQWTFGEMLVLPDDDNDPAECNTVCCIGGHAFILAKGAEAYMKNVVEEGELDTNYHAFTALGLTYDQADVLFDTVITGSAVERVFGVKVDWEISKSADEVAALLRQIADKYDTVQ